jgi:hypothetical protein
MVRNNHSAYLGNEVEVPGVQRHTAGQQNVQLWADGQRQNRETRFEYAQQTARVSQEIKSEWETHSARTADGSTAILHIRTDPSSQPPAAAISVWFV